MTPTEQTALTAYHALRDRHEAELATFLQSAHGTALQAILDSGDVERLRELAAAERRGWIGLSARGKLRKMEVGNG